MKVNRREFSAALLGLAAFPGKLLDDFDQSPRRPSILLLPDEPFSGIGVLKGRLDAGQRPSEDMPGWALSWQLTRKNEFAERAISAMRVLPSAPKDSASRSWMHVVALSLAVRLALRASGVRCLTERKPCEPPRGQRRGGAGFARPGYPTLASYHNYTLRYLAVASFALAAVRGHRSVLGRSRHYESMLSWRLTIFSKPPNWLRPRAAITSPWTTFGSRWRHWRYSRSFNVPPRLSILRRYKVFGSIGVTYLYKLMPMERLRAKATMNIPSSTIVTPRCLATR